MVSCNRPLVARTCPARDENGAPSMSVTLPSGLGYDQRAARNVPRLEIAFPEPVHPAGRDVTEIDGRRPKPPDGAGAADERANRPTISSTR